MISQVLTQNMTSIWLGLDAMFRTKVFTVAKHASPGRINSVITAKKLMNKLICKF